MPELNVLIKPASGLCNMRCSYCFYADEMNHRMKSSYGIMTDEVMEQVVKKSLAFASGRCTFVFQGGEPCLAGLPFYRRWVGYEKKYNVNKVEISHAIQTNGFLTDDEWCRFWARHNFLVGLSVDGTESAHDAYRKDAEGNGTYRKAEKAAELLRASNVEFNILTVVNNKTAPQIRQIYEAYRRQGFLWQQYIACLDPVGREPGKMEYSVTPKMYGEFLIELFRLWETDLRKRVQPYIRQFENYIGILLGIPPESCEQRGVCGFQNVVEADGSVYPCDFYVLDEYRIGSLMEDDFYGLEEKRRKSAFVEQSCNHAAECIKCEYHFICRAGCRRHREQSGGTESINYFCEGYKMFFDACLPSMKKTADWIRYFGSTI